MDVNEFSDIKELLASLDASNVPVDLKKEAYKMIVRLYRMAKYGTYSSEFEVVSKYVDWIVKIPWGVYSQDNLDIEHVREVLNSTHYGLNKVKEKILSYLAVMKLKKINMQLAESNNAGSNDNQGNSQIDIMVRPPVFCFVGLQGLGKTTIAKSIAKALGRKFVKVSLAAFGDIKQLRGSSKADPNAEPGVIIQGLVRAKTMNPVFLLDEIDKASGIESLRNDIYSALLEILDPVQNRSFVDKYINYPVDLSNVFFITTANTLGNMTAALLDRLEIIRFTSYTDEEKIKIAKDYLMPKVLNASGLKSSQLIITDESWPLIVRPMGYDSGIRQLERTLMNLARKVAYKIVTGKVSSVKITPENIRQYLPDDMGVLG